MLQDLDALRHKIEIISGGTYSLSLTTVDPTQVLYNGKFSYLMNYENPQSGAWCHLLLLRSKTKHSKQILAIITQTPDCNVSIVNFIENVATFVINFFNRFHPPFYPPVLRDGENEDKGRITLTPDNTIFVEYLPAWCFGQVSGHHDKDTFAVMHFDWEEVPMGQSRLYYRVAEESSDEMWEHTGIETINDLITRL